MDIGAFVSALEYATQQPTLVIGKPLVDFSRVALTELNVTAGQTAIAYAIDSDIDRGQDAGLRGILVKTGKYQRDYAERSPIKQELMIDSVAALPHCLKLTIMEA